MYKRKLTKQEEYDKYISAFNYGQQAINPLSNEGLINNKNTRRIH